MHRQFFRIISRNPDYVTTHCNDLNNPLKIAIRKWMNEQQIDVVTVSVIIFENLFNDVLYFFLA